MRDKHLMGFSMGGLDAFTMMETTTSMVGIKIARLVATGLCTLVDKELVRDCMKMGIS